MTRENNCIHYHLAGLFYIQLDISIMNLEEDLYTELQSGASNANY